jgi:hypothetical protein
MKKEKKQNKTKEKYPEGHFIGLWMAIGIAIFSGFGIPISVSTGNSGLIGIGPAVGICIGLAIGSSIENRYKKQGSIRPLTKKEKNRQKISLIIGILILLIGILATSLIFFLR